MMKKILVITMLFFTMTAISQEVKFSKNFDVKTGSPYKVVDASNKHYYEKDNKIIAIKAENDNATIQIIDGATLKEISKKEFDDFPKKTEFRYTAQTESGIYYFYTVWDKKEKSENFYVRELDLNTGSLESPKLLFSTSQKVEPSTIKQVYNVLTQNSSDYSFNESFDGENYLIQYRVRPEVKRDKNSHDILGFHVFDKNFNKKWSKEIEMPHTEKEMNNVTYTVNTKGDVYMIAFINETKTYEFFEIAENTTKIKPVAIDIEGDLFFNEIGMFEKSDGTINCIGYYANGLEFKFSYFGGMSSSMNINGITQFTLNTEGEVLSSYKVEFPIEFINQYENDRARNKNEKRDNDGKLGIRDLQLRTFMEYEDGSTLVLGEQFFSEYQYDPMASSGKTLHNYYEDVIATKIDKDGNVIWMKKLPKEQERTPKAWSWKADNRGGLSIKHVSSEDNHYVLFMDNVKNIDLPMDEKPARHMDRKGGYLTAYKVNDKTGDVEKLSILNVDDLNGYSAYQFRTSRLLLSEANELFLEVYVKGKKDIMVKIGLKD